MQIKFKIKRNNGFTTSAYNAGLHNQFHLQLKTKLVISELHAPGEFPIDIRMQS